MKKNNLSDKEKLLKLLRNIYRFEGKFSIVRCGRGIYSVGKTYGLANYLKKKGILIFKKVGSNRRPTLTDKGKEYMNILNKLICLENE